MAIQMARPTKHPKSGTYRVRLMIPPILRDAALKLCGVRSELTESLGTKDAREASRLGPAALARLNVRLEAIAQHHAGAGRDPSDRDVAAMAGEAYSGRLKAQGGSAGTPDEWLLDLDIVGDQRNTLNEQGDYDVDPDRHDRQEAERRLRAGGWSETAANVERLASGVVVARALFAQTMLRRSRGDWSPEIYSETFPAVASLIPDPMPAAVLTFDAVIVGWAKDHGHSLDIPPVSRAAYDRKRTLTRLGQFLGHTDAVAVTKADVVRWKEDMQSRGLAVATIRNDVSECSAVWSWSIRNGKLEVNPFEGTSPPRERRRRNSRRAFTQDEAVAILTAARTRTGYLRWLPWVCCLTGARLSEICQGTKADIVAIGGIYVLRIHDDGEADSEDYRSLKNSDSRRDIPLHPALLAEGFLTYVRALPVGSPLFPDARPDGIFGNRAINAGKKLSRWMRTDLGITDKRISPNHSWRHWFIEACRGTQMHPEVRSALTGHSARLDESAQYGAGMGSFVRVLHDALALVPSPLSVDAIETG